MASKILLKLIDRAIIPALLLVFGKIVALFLINFSSGYGFEIAFASKIIPHILYTDPGQTLIAHSYSNAIMYFIIFIGFLGIIIRSTQFHDTHISPKKTAQLAQRNLLGLLVNSFDIYSEAAAWFIFLWTATGLLVLYSAAGLTYWAFSITAFLLSLIMSYLLIEDIEGEVRVRRFSRT